jgi:uncharacterized protein (TIGR02246 family)
VQNASFQDLTPIRDVAHRWAAAVRERNTRELAALMTDDVVVIHGDGRVVAGREAVLADFAVAFDRFHVDQTMEFEETIVAGEWAVDRANVSTALLALESRETRHVLSRTLTILRKDDTGGWRVARTMGVIVQDRPG